MPKKPSASVAKTLKKAGVKAPKKRKEVFWKGPTEDGITQSLLNKFLTCPERFRLHTIEGLAPTPTFNKNLEYGNMWHICEEFYAGNKDWEQPLREYAQTLLQKYPLQQEEVSKWYRVCKVQFPAYCEFWKHHKQEKQRSPIYQEVSFAVDYTTPRGNTVKMRGKWDQVDSIGKEVWLKENKTKGDIDEMRIQRQLSFDIQTMFYIVALQTHFQTEKPELASKIRGVRYNVIRRPLSGGKGSIRQHQPTKSNPAGETLDEFYERLRKDYIDAEPEYWFMRWECPVHLSEIEKYKTEFLNPIFDRLCAWYDSVKEAFLFEKSPFALDSSLHYRMPFGIYNPLAEAGFTDVDEFLLTGSTSGMAPLETLFPELE